MGTAPQSAPIRLQRWAAAGTSRARQSCEMCRPGTSIVPNLGINVAFATVWGASLVASLPRALRRLRRALNIPYPGVVSVPTTTSTYAVPFHVSM